MGAKEVIKTIKNHSRFLITSHINLEGDALGSELALASLLRKLGKTVYLVNDDKPPVNYRFLPGVKGTRCSLGTDKVSGRGGDRFQVAIIIDCSDKQRIGKIAKLIDSQKRIINIDHHFGNNNFGQVNWVEPQASSTGEMVYHLFKLTRTKLERKDALNIYTAILTDTGSFRHANTTSRTLAICSELLKYGILPAQIYSQIYERHSLNEARYLIKIISKMSFEVNNKLAWVRIDRQILREILGRHEIFDKILDFAKSINTVRLAIIFYQEDRRLVKVSLRSKSPVSARRLAVFFGGGGHKLASGCIIKANLQEAERLVLTQARKLLASY